MVTVKPRAILRDALVGFGLGLAVMATLGVLSWRLAPKPPAAAVAPR
jgi:hypothetical protein